MLYTVIILYIISIIYQLKKVKGKYVVLLITGTVSLTLATVMSIIQICLTGTYYVSAVNIENLASAVAYLVSKLELSYYNVLLLKNIGIFCYMTNIIIFTVMAVKERNIVVCVLLTTFMALFPIAYFIYYNPGFAYECYINIHTSEYPEKTMLFYRKTDDIFDICKYVFPFLPNIIMLVYYLKSRVWIRKKQMMFANIYFFIINLLFCMIFIWGIFGNTYIYNNELNYMRVNAVNTKSSFIWTMLLTLILLLVIQYGQYGIVKMKLFETGGSLKNFRLMHYSEKMRGDIRNSYHFIKNIFFNIEVLAKQGAEAESVEQTREIFHKIQSISDKNLQKLVSLVASFDDVSIDSCEERIDDIIDYSIEETVIPDNITIIRDIEGKDLYADCDFYYLSEAFINIITNAVEAITAVNREEGIIKISVKSGENMILINFKDNGVGISSKNLKRLFRPMYTSKNRDTNWGVGLFYVHKIIDAHGGFITIRSKENKGTEISIALNAVKNNNI